MVTVLGHFKICLQIKILNPFSPNQKLNNNNPNLNCCLLSMVFPPPSDSSSPVAENNRSFIVKGRSEICIARDCVVKLCDANGERQRLLFVCKSPWVSIFGPEETRREWYQGKKNLIEEVCFWCDLESLKNA